MVPLQLKDSLYLKYQSVSKVLVIFLRHINQVLPLYNLKDYLQFRMKHQQRLSFINKIIHLVFHLLFLRLHIFKLMISLKDHRNLRKNALEFFSYNIHFHHRN
jgi:hypothetical protein